MPAALTPRDEAYVRRRDYENKTSFDAINGAAVQASGFSSIDVGCRHKRRACRVVRHLDRRQLVTRRGEPKSTKIVIDLTGEGPDGAALRTCHAVFHRGARHQLDRGCSSLSGAGPCRLSRPTIR
jgi:hypothetical protein